MTDHRDLPPAPDWEPGIPSGWERSGPAWRQIYWAIPDRLWVKATDVADTLTHDTGLARATIANYIRKAALAGILERRRRPIASKIRYEYRRPRLDQQGGTG